MRFGVGLVAWASSLCVVDLATSSSDVTRFVGRSWHTQSLHAACAELAILCGVENIICGCLALDLVCAERTTASRQLYDGGYGAGAKREM